MRRWITSLLVCLLFSFSYANPSLARETQGPIRAFVSILPQAYFVERIGVPYTKVEVLVGPGHSPATYEPTPQQMTKLGKAHVYFRVGTPFERGFIEKISRTFKNLMIVDTRENVPLLYFRNSGGAEVADPHIWLDPVRVKIQAETICKALIHIDPEHEKTYRHNLSQFLRDLDAIDTKIRSLLAPLRGSKIYVFHPAFGYFCHSYGLDQVAVEIEGKEPSPKQLSHLITQAKKDGVRVIFVQPQFSTKDAEAVARAINGAVVPINPLSREYLKNLENMSTIIRKALLKQK